MNRTALITGATSGIGRACSYKLAENGYNLILTGRRSERLSELKKDLSTKFNISPTILCFDVRDKIEVRKASDKLAIKSLDILINNAGLALGKSLLDEGDPEDWEQMIDTNIKGILFITQAFLPFLKKSENAHIINIGSIAGSEVYEAGNVYCASKHAVNALSKGMRIDLLKYKIKVTQLRPGLTNTEFSTVRFKGDKNKADEIYAGYTPLSGEDIADIVLFTLNTPRHVCLNDIEITPLAQANAYLINKQ